jgi:hypothetical protein
MLLATLLLATWFDAGVMHAPRCTFVRTGLQTRAEQVTFTVVRATTDSVSDGRYYSFASDRAGRTPLFDGATATTVHGQIFSMLRAEGAGADALRSHECVVLIWWRRGHSCQRYFPASALFITSGEVLVVRDARPPSEWVAGMPTFDMIEMSDDLYPTRQQLTLGVPDSVPRLSFAEFIDMYRQLPTAAEKEADYRNAGARLLRWGDADARRWRTSPARELLCDAFRARAQEPLVPLVPCPDGARP